MLSLLHIMTLDVYSEVLKNLNKATSLRATCTQLALLSREHSRKNRKELVKLVRINSMKVIKQCTFSLIANGKLTELISDIYVIKDVQDPDGSLERSAFDKQEEACQKLASVMSKFKKFVLYATWKYSFDPSVRPMLRAAIHAIRQPSNVPTPETFESRMSTKLFDVVELTENMEA